MVASVFSYTHSMSSTKDHTTAENDMIFEWEHSMDDEVITQAFVIQLFSQSPFHRARKSRHIKVSSLIVLVLFAWSYFSGGPSSLYSTIIVMVILLPLGFLLVHLLSGRLSNTASFHAKAKGFIKFKKNLPVGKRRLVFSSGMLEWYSYADDETVKYPSRFIDQIQEQDQRIFFSRDHTLRGSIPFRAFGDESTRLNFLEAVEQSRNETKP